MFRQNTKPAESTSDSEFTSSQKPEGMNTKAGFKPALQADTHVEVGLISIEADALLLDSIAKRLKEFQGDFSSAEYTKLYDQYERLSDKLNLKEVRIRELITVDEQQLLTAQSVAIEKSKIEHEQARLNKAQINDQKNTLLAAWTLFAFALALLILFIITKNILLVPYILGCLALGAAALSVRVTRAIVSYGKKGDNKDANS